ncbi:MAG TPA: histidine kinase [Saprospiraceae bacterium]|nr:histidine kinase [Saprospiraceae bacterium]HMQ82875.1 histidine kinase [Saprospiraceae bacterium]
MRGGDIQSPFFEDERGNIWFTTGEGINCYRKIQGDFIHDFAGGSDEENSGIHYAFYMEAGRYLWVLSKNSVYKYDTQQTRFSKRIPVFENFEAARCAVLTDSEGIVKTIIGCFWKKPGIEIIQLSEKSSILSRQTWFEEVNNPAAFTVRVSHAIGMENGKVLMITDKGLLHFDSTNPLDFDAPYEVTSGANLSYSIIHSNNNEYWVVRQTPAVHVLDPVKKICRPSLFLYNLDKKSKIEKADYVFPIQDSIVWISSTRSGVYFAHLSNIRFKDLLNINDLESFPVDHLFLDPIGHVCCVSNDGHCLAFDENHAFIKKEKTPVDTRYISGIDNRNWSISIDGLSSVHNNSFTSVYKSDPSEIFSDLADYDDRLLLLGTNRGLWFFDKRKQAMIPSTYESWTVKLFVDSQRRVWAANTSDDLTLWQIEYREKPELKPIKTFGGLGLIHHLAEDPYRNVIWVATSKGLLQIDRQKLTTTLITEADGLPNQFIYTVVLDNKQRLWLSSNKGIIRYRPEAKPDKRFKSYTSRDGLSSDEYLPGSGLMTKNGEIWFGSTMGVDVFHPDSVREVGNMPKLAITSLKIHDREWKGDTSITYAKQVELSYKENTLTLDLAALEYTDPMRNQFKVFLKHNDGIDSSFLGTKNSITYANLSPGRYTFQFTACNAEGIWQVNPRQLIIVIKPHFTQTAWFRYMVALLSLAAVGFVSALYYRYQLRAKELELEKEKREAERKQLQLEKKLTLQKERNRIAGEMHDELGGGLSTIHNASEKALKKQSLEEAQPIIKRVSQLSIGLINNMRTIIWAMDPEFDALSDLTAYLRRYTKEFLNDNSIEVDIHIPADLPPVTLSGHFRYNLLLVVKEALHNIVKHAKASQVHFELTASENLKICIKDDGIGFDPEKLEKTGFGLRNMSKRAAVIGGKIGWTPLNEGGMMVVFEAPMENAL